MAAAKKEATNTTKPATPAGPPAGGSPPAGAGDQEPAKVPKGKYFANWHVRVNKQDYTAGDEVTGLTDKQCKELLEVGAIEKK